VNAIVYSMDRQEGTWNVDPAPQSEAEFRARVAACDAKLAMILRPVTFKIDGKSEGGKYTGLMNVSIEGKVPAGCSVHYVVDSSEPTPKSSRYDGPVQVAGTLRPRAAIFDDKTGELVGGYVFGPQTAYHGFEQTLSTGKPVEASGPRNNDEGCELAGDGWVDSSKFWGSIPAPQWWKVDLQKEYQIDRVHVYPFWDEVRYYQYTVEVSTDGKDWKQVIDASKNTTPGTEKGYLHKFDATPARYVRVNMLKNSDNPAVHLVEVRVYEAGK
ncbi:MAG: discoidin domain-containing protein, partial [Planctomycetota bacterium]|nr:discoidin domain-containing protein [Planctomycetota bacterium]